MSRRVISTLIFPPSTFTTKNVIGSGVGGVSTANRAALRRRASNNSRGDPCCMTGRPYTVVFEISSSEYPAIDGTYYLSQTIPSAIYSSLDGSIEIEYDKASGQLQISSTGGPLAYAEVEEGTVPDNWKFGSGNDAGVAEGTPLDNIVINRTLSPSYGPVANPSG